MQRASQLVAYTNNTPHTDQEGPQVCFAGLCQPFLIHLERLRSIHVRELALARGIAFRTSKPTYVLRDTLLTGRHFILTNVLLYLLDYTHKITRVFSSLEASSI